MAADNLRRSFRRTKISWRCAPRHKSCFNRCTCSELGGFLATNLLVLLATSGFCLFLLPDVIFIRIWVACPDGRLQRDLWTFFVPVGALVWACLIYITLWSTYFLDPGVIPRKDEFDLARLTSLEHGERACITCKIIRPPSGKHCKYCDHCVEMFDHHCPFVGVCIGEGNYPCFLLLLATGFTGTSYLCVFSLYYLEEHWSIDGLVWRNWDCSKSVLAAALSVSVTMGLLALRIGYLIGYHIMICITGETTNQRKKVVRGSPDADFRRVSGRDSEKENRPLNKPLLVDKKNIKEASQQPIENAKNSMEDSFDASSKDTRCVDL